jgi:hypothetical protein
MASPDHIETVGRATRICVSVCGSALTYRKKYTILDLNDSNTRILAATSLAIASLTGSAAWAATTQDALLPRLPPHGNVNDYAGIARPTDFRALGALTPRGLAALVSWWFLWWCYWRRRHAGSAPT